MKLVHCVCLVLAATCLSAGTASAQTAGSHLLEDIDISAAHGCISIEVLFATPTRYMRHFPPSHSDQLLIQLFPLGDHLHDDAIRFNRESLSYPQRDDLPLREVTFEMDRDGAGTLVLEFSRTVSYTVIPGRNIRSLVIHVDSRAQSASTPPCWQ